jgi:uncharacterized glyoxalase superfamily protein PhnB
VNAGLDFDCLEHVDGGRAVADVMLPAAAIAETVLSAEDVLVTVCQCKVEWALPMRLFWLLLLCRCITSLSADDQAAAVLSTVQRIAMLLQWQQQSSGSSSSDGELTFQQQLTAVSRTCLSVSLLVECLLLLPGTDMASSCLQAIVLMMQQANAIFKQAAEEGTLQQRNQLLSPLGLVLRSTLADLASAVYHVAQQASSVKERRHLLQLWADAAAALLDETGVCWNHTGRGVWQSVSCSRHAYLED